MLLPEKHITLAESVIGLGAYVLKALDRPRTLDYLFRNTRILTERGELPAFHDFDSVTLAVVFLYTVGLVESTETGLVRRCDL